MTKSSANRGAHDAGDGPSVTRSEPVGGIGPTGVSRARPVPRIEKDRTRTRCGRAVPVASSRPARSSTSDAAFGGSMELEKKLRVGHDFQIKDLDPDATPGIRDKRQAARILERAVQRLFELQYDLYAEDQRALLLVFQAMDAGGKDGTVRALAHGLNPLGCRVASFKVPSVEEASHDFLWRVHHACPRKGEVGIFNRSHYEDVLVVRVQELVPKSVWLKRYDQINAFERHLSENGTTIVKFYLHISKDEQKQRLMERLV